VIPGVTPYVRLLNHLCLTQHWDCRRSNGRGLKSWGWFDRPRWWRFSKNVHWL